MYYKTCSEMITSNVRNKHRNETCISVLGVWVTLRFFFCIQRLIVNMIIDFNKTPLGNIANLKVELY